MPLRFRVHFKILPLCCLCCFMLGSERLRVSSDVTCLESSRINWGWQKAFLDVAYHFWHGQWWMSLMASSQTSSQDCSLYLIYKTKKRLLVAFSVIIIIIIYLYYLFILFICLYYLFVYIIFLFIGFFETEKYTSVQASFQKKTEKRKRKNLHFCLRPQARETQSNLLVAFAV